MIKKFGADLLGILLIVLALLLGWIPGPGGIPLLIAGLGLLAINHEWARRWLRTVEKHGLNLSSKIFRKHRVWQFVIDLLGVIILVLGVWLFSRASHSFMYAFAFSLGVAGVMLLLGNRRRLGRFRSYFKA